MGNSYRKGEAGLLFIVFGIVVLLGVDFHIEVRIGEGVGQLQG